MKGRDTRGRTLQLVYGGLVFFISFGVYLRTLSPTVGFVDSGELTTVAYTLGIAHPTGYPLYTLLSRLFTLIPFGSIAWRVNLASAFFASLAVLFVYLLSKILLDNRTGREGFTATATATATALLFSFSSTLWSQAVVAEVYSLTAFLSSLLLYLVVRFTNNESREGVLRLRRIEPLLFFFIFGLSLGNHMTILTVAIPCVIYLFLKSKAVSGQRPAVSHLTFNILHFSFFILLGLSLYLYLPIRSSQDPILNWGEPKTLTQFFWHISGKQYKVWFLSSSPSVLIQHLQQFLKIWFDQFTPYLLPLCILGIFLLFIKSKGIGLLLLSIFLLNLFYGINYDIPDIDAFFLPLFFITAIWVGGGILIIMSVLPKGFSLLFVLLPLIPMISHFG